MRVKIHLHYGIWDVANIGGVDKVNNTLLIYPQGCTKPIEYPYRSYLELDEGYRQVEQAIKLYEEGQPEPAHDNECATQQGDRCDCGAGEVTNP